LPLVISTSTAFTKGDLTPKASTDHLKTHCGWGVFIRVVRKGNSPPGEAA
jgi:hypothetical protein